MVLTVNGKITALAEVEPLAIPELLDKLDVADPLYVTVELNGKIIDRKAHEVTNVTDGDTVEFLYFMGGGER